MSGDLLQYVSEKQWRRSVVARLGKPSLATDATTGFLWVPACEGVPTGTPVPIEGMLPLVADSLTGTLYMHDGAAWNAL